MRRLAWVLAVAGAAALAVGCTEPAIGGEFGDTSLGITAVEHWVVIKNAAKPRDTLAGQAVEFDVSHDYRVSPWGGVLGFALGADVPVDVSKTTNSTFTFCSPGPGGCSAVGAERDSLSEDLSVDGHLDLGWAPTTQVLILGQLGARATLFSWRQRLDYHSAYPTTNTETVTPFFGPDARLKLIFAGKTWDAHLEGGYACLAATHQTTAGAHGYLQSACVAETGAGVSWHF